MAPIKRIHLLRAGSHTDNASRKHDFSAAVLDDVAGSYDPALHEAPLVVGHTAANRPVYGLVASLSAGPDGLYATPKQVDPEFGELVKAGCSLCSLSDFPGQSKTESIFHISSEFSEALNTTILGSDTSLTPIAPRFHPK